MNDLRFINLSSYTTPKVVEYKNKEWIGYGEDIMNPEGSETVTSWSNTTGNFDPQKYVQSHLKGYLNTLPKNQPKPVAPKSKPKGGASRFTPSPANDKVTDEEILLGTNKKPLTDKETQDVIDSMKLPSELK